MPKVFIKKNKSEEGLTMAELLVTISIIVLIATVILVLGDKALRQTDFFAKRTQALFLAKEGVEVVTDITIRNLIRDDIATEVTDGTWSGEGYWNVDYQGSVEQKSDKASCHNKLKIDTTGFYAIGEAGDEETFFSRCIIVTATDDSDDLELTSEVLYDHKGNDYSVNLYRIFYD
jgi:hypothetical protein